MGNYNKYFVASESDWEKEKAEHDNVDDGLDVLIQLDRTIDRAFDILSNDTYGNMSNYSYDSIAGRIGNCKTKNNKITNYANGIYGILEDKENDFHKQLSRAMESLSKLDIEDYEVDNTLDIEEWHTVSNPTYNNGAGAYTQPTTTTTTYKTKKRKITFSDIQAKTDMFELKEQFAEYLKVNKKNGKNVSEAEVDRLRKEFYRQALSTSFDHTVYNDGWWSTFSTTLDYIPLVGGIKGIIEGCIGTTMTGEQLSSNERLQYALMGTVSTAVDIFTFGAASAAVQGTKAVIKEGAKIIAKDVLTGWSLNLGSQALVNMNLPPELAFMAHIGLNIAISRSNIKKAKGASGAKTPEQIIKNRTEIPPEMEEKILWSRRKNPNKNEVIGGHSPGINNDHPNYAVEVIKTNSDGTKQVKFTTQFEDGNLANIKKSTLFPDKWSNDDIINSIKNVGDSTPLGVRVSDGATLHRGIVNGVQVEVIKIGDSVVSGYPTGGVNTKLLPGFK